MTYSIYKDALLMLENGSYFYGNYIANKGIAVGEIVFNTGMTGYQEIITDPSYASQMIAFTYPHIGNTGINDEDNESDSVWASGIIVKDFVPFGSNRRATKSLTEFLQENNVICISNIDTRSLTHQLRQYGSMAGCIVDAKTNKEQALLLAKSWKQESCNVLIERVACKKIYNFRQSKFADDSHYMHQKNWSKEHDKYKVVVFDFGVKRSILNSLANRGLFVTVVPPSTTLSEVQQIKPHGIVFSNGPGDPRNCKNLINKISEILSIGLPVLGICLGHQLLSIAYGAKITKMKFGHHGTNHPVYDYKKSAVAISSQNHNFTVSEDELPESLEIIAKSLFDDTIQGVKHKVFNAIGFQGHPESGPGPMDCNYMFDYFLDYIKK